MPGAQSPPVSSPFMGEANTDGTLQQLHRLNVRHIAGTRAGKKAAGHPALWRSSTLEVCGSTGTCTITQMTATGRALTTKIVLLAKTHGETYWRGLLARQLVPKQGSSSPLFLMPHFL